jgi:4a-hydroxytetrahydrobiopterin dehydratase
LLVIITETDGSRIGYHGFGYHGCRRDYMTEQLADKKCVPCRGGVPPIKGRELQALLKAVPLWNVVNEHHLTREYKFPDFKQALDFVNRVGALAEEQGHHPDILLAWGRAEITLWTHKIDGLTESDFIMAAKIDRLIG